MKTILPSPQLSPLTALAQLVQEHPELPAVGWRVGSDGYLMGHLTVDVDARPVMAAFVSVLGGDPIDTWSAPDAQFPQFSSWMYATWRDVTLSLTVVCPVVLAPRDASVLPAEDARRRADLLVQRHQLEDAAEPPAAYSDDALVSLPVSAWSAVSV